jgi:hypothetical protein
MKFPTDIEAANEAWGANCGPCALAAILGRKVEDVRSLVMPMFEKKGCMTPTDMKAALDKAGVAHSSGPKKEWPECGLVFIQWGGFESRPVIAQYRFTHWVAVRQGKLFDLNLPELTTRPDWERFSVDLSKAFKGNGTYWVRASILVHEAEPLPVWRDEFKADGGAA